MVTGMILLLHVIQIRTERRSTEKRDIIDWVNLN